MHCSYRDKNITSKIHSNDVTFFLRTRPRDIVGVKVIPEQGNRGGKGHLGRREGESTSTKAELGLGGVRGR